MECMIDWRPYISHDPAVLRGNATLTGTRIGVDLILRKLAEGATVAELEADYPTLTEDAILACLAYAADLAAGEQTFDLVPGAPR
jgi:uncharacterized protein (DUF433 family)